MILRRCCVQDSEQALIDVTRGVSGFPDMEVRICIQVAKVANPRELEGNCTYTH